MNQVALIEVPLIENVVALGLFVNGHQVMVSGRNSGHDVLPTRHVAQDMAQALNVELTSIISPAGQGGADWCWNEIQTDMINAGRLAPPRGSTTLMKGFYRCPSCFEQWTMVDTLNDAQYCQSCNHGMVEPYYSGDPSATVEDTLLALKQQERQYPNPAEQGEYDVAVCRSGAKHATLTIKNAAGPASAHLMALDAAGDHEFGSDSSFEFEITDVAPMVVGAVKQSGNGASEA